MNISRHTLYVTTAIAGLFSLSPLVAIAQTATTDTSIISASEDAGTATHSATVGTVSTTRGPTRTPATSTGIIVTPSTGGMPSIGGITSHTGSGALDPVLTGSGSNSVGGGAAGAVNVGTSGTSHGAGIPVLTGSGRPPASTGTLDPVTPRPSGGTRNPDHEIPPRKPRPPSYDYDPNTASELALGKIIRLPPKEEDPDATKDTTKDVSRGPGDIVR